MSLNRTLDRLFDEIRREAKRNPEFAQRLDAVLRLHDSRREIEDEVLEAIAREGDAAATPEPVVAAPEAAAIAAPPFNPVGLLKREGEEALGVALLGFDEAALRALIDEHNLDPVGAAEGLSMEALRVHIVARAKRRAERDEKMFDY
jgi:hypothetical protein